MATIDTFSTGGNSSVMRSYVSDEALVADTVDMDGLDPSFTHHFLGVKIVDVSGNPVLGGAGTLAVTYYTANNNQAEVPGTATIDATAPATIAIEGNITRVVLTPTGITTAISYTAVLTSNRS